VVVTSDTLFRIFKLLNLVAKSGGLTTYVSPADEETRKRRGVYRARDSNGADMYYSYESFCSRTISLSQTTAMKASVVVCE
jgi:hypothetical protein